MNQACVFQLYPCFEQWYVLVVFNLMKYSVQLGGWGRFVLRPADEGGWALWRLAFGGGRNHDCRPISKA